MQASDFILAILSSMPEREVVGKKRLQKIVYLLKEFGAECDAEFQLMRFGPFSVQLAKSADFLSIFDHISEEEKPLGNFGAFVTVYSLPQDDSKSSPQLDKNSLRRLLCLVDFSTIDLEVAATIRYFKSRGLDQKKAEEQTKKIKPTKATLPVLVSSRKILECLN